MSSPEAANRGASRGPNRLGIRVPPPRESTPASSSNGSSVSFHRAPADLRRQAIERFARKLEAGIACGNAFHCRITTDRELRRLNREFRGEDRATDVLSFPALNGVGDSPEIAFGPSNRARDIGFVLSQPQQIGFVSSRSGTGLPACPGPFHGIGGFPEIGFVSSHRPPVGAREIGFASSSRLRNDAARIAKDRRGRLSHSSNRGPVGASPKIGFALTNQNPAGDRASPSNPGREKDESAISLKRGSLEPAPQAYLGDIAISLPRARTQARAFGHSVEQECGILMLHGLLHLLGMDHETDGGRMARFERRWRARLGLPAGLIERVEP